MSQCSGIILMNIVMVYKLCLVCCVQVLHYLPSSERKDVGSGSTEIDASSTKHLAGVRHMSEELQVKKNAFYFISLYGYTIFEQFLTGVSSANGIPAHMLRLDQFHEQLQHLLAHFQLQCGTRDLRTPADEMELLGLVCMGLSNMYIVR